MANKKAASSTKKSASKTTTKVTTIKAGDTASSAPAPATTAKAKGIGAMPLLPAAIAEFVGTFMLAAVVVTQQNQPIALLFALIGIVLIIGGISGAHVNPAITIAAWVTKKIQASRAVMYLVAQILGAMLAFVVLNGFINQAPEASQQAAMLGQATELFTATPVSQDKIWAIVFAELIGAAILGLAYASALVKGRQKVEAALGIGGGVFLALIIAGTAASYVQGMAILNPAAAISLEAFGSSMQSMQPLLVYTLVPVIGASIGMILFTMINRYEK